MCRAGRRTRGRAAPGIGHGLLPDTAKLAALVPDGDVVALMAALVRSGLEQSDGLSACAGVTAASDADLHFWFDPVCPFAWMTSTWVRRVSAQREYTVDWRPISLRLLNAHIDYDSHFPPEYERGHTAGLRLLRVAALARQEHGGDAVARLYEAYGALIFQVPPGQDVPGRLDAGELVPDALAAAGLPPGLAVALDDPSWDAGIQASTDEALSLTGKDVGTPILHVEPPHGVAFFGPVISRLPSEDDAVALWDHVVGLARFPGFAELKRSLRELPQLPALGVSADQAGKTEDWHGGSRRQKR